MTEPRRNSYFVILLTLLLAGWFGLGTPLVAAFFASFVLHRLTFLRRKSLTVLVCLVLVSIICRGLVYFLEMEACRIKVQEADKEETGARASSPN
jgi:ABC-type bacteriocin/lantibiotic exporter with double-glycine peptidase domain